MTSLRIEQYLRPAQTITSENELRQRLEELPLDDDPYLQLVGEAGDSLGIAVSGEHAFVNFARHDGNAFTATLVPSDQLRRPWEYPEEEQVNFIVGSTKTPFPKAYCVPVQMGIDIVLHYFRTGRLPDWVNWDED